MEKIVEPKTSCSNSYCLILGKISASTPIRRMLVLCQHELWHSIRAPGPTSHCSVHTSSALLLHIPAPPSSASVARCCPHHCPRNWKKEKGADLKHTSVNIAQSTHYSVSPQVSNHDFVFWLLLHYCFVYLPLPPTVLHYWKVPIWVAKWWVFMSLLYVNPRKARNQKSHFIFQTLHCILDCKCRVARGAISWGPFQYISQVHRGDDDTGGAGQRGRD